MVFLVTMQHADNTTCGQMHPNSLFGNHLFAVIDVLLPTRLHRWPESATMKSFGETRGSYVFNNRFNFRKVGKQENAKQTRLYHKAMVMNNVNNINNHQKTI